MADVIAVLADNRTAINELIAAAEQSAPTWAVARAPGKWSPSQVVEHVALTMEESAKLVAGTPSKLPTIPALARPLLRGLFFKRILKKGAFPKAKTVKALDPANGPATPAEARTRLEAALAAFDRECRARAARDERVDSGVFGAVSVQDYARFQELHVRHHRKQMPA